MKRLLLLFVLGLVATGMTAQEITKVAKAKDIAKAPADADTVKRWYISGSGNLTVTQASFTNWAAGGENSVGLDALLNFQANYKHGKHAWGNTVALGYGMQLLGKGDDQRFTKTNDKLELTTAYGYEIHKNKKWYATVLGNFRSQFAPGYNYPNDSVIISKFFAPAYVIIGVGVTYNPFKGLTLYLSPSSGRFTFVEDTALSVTYGLSPGDKFRGEFGPYFRGDLNKDLAKNINLSSTLELFTDYLKDFGNIDVNWSILLTMKVNKWLAATVSTQLIYDNDITIGATPTETGGPRTQFKEQIGVGLAYIFNNQPKKE